MLIPYIIIEGIFIINIINVQDKEWAKHIMMTKKSFSVLHE